MMPALICHLGDFRTGSTAIQSVLRHRAAEFGLHWPEGANHAGLAQSLGEKAARDAEWSWLAAEMEGSGRPTIVSAEHFEFAAPERLAETLDLYLPRVPVRLIAYVRPHGAGLLARYAESVKIGNFDGTPDAYLDWPQTRVRLAYATRFGRWRAVFGERFTLRLYDRAAFPGGSVVRDLLTFATGRDPGDIAVPDGNPTPGLADLALARAIHRAMGEIPEAARAARWTLGREIGRLMAAVPRTDTPLRLDQSLCRRLLAEFGADAAALDAAFFAPHRPMTDALAAAEVAALAEPQSHAPEDHLGAETLRVAGLWGRMLGQGLRAPGGAEALDRLYHE